MTAEVAQLSQQKQVFGEAVCNRIRESIAMLGFPDSSAIDWPFYNEADFNLVTDPFTQSRDLVGIWHDAK